MKGKSASSNVVAFGRDETRKRIREEIESGYSAQLREAGFIQRSWLRRKIHNEVKRKLDKEAPESAIY